MTLCLLIENIERFVQERKYLQNVSPGTIEIYSNSLRLVCLLAIC